jgi:predicted dehydrogenase
MEQQVSVGVIGYGYWGPNLVRNFHDDDRVEVRYICDRSADMLNKHRKRYQTTKFTTDYDDLLNDKTLTAIAIATPAATHFELARKALEAGKHVLVEKPMCRTSDQCRELIAIAEQNDRTLMVDHTFLYHGPVRLIKQLIETGDLGNLLYFNSVRVNLGAFQQDCNVVWDLGAHDLAIMDYLVGRTPISVHATGASHTGNDIEDIAYVTLKFEDELIAHIQCSWLSPVKIRQIFIGGSRKMIVFDDASQVEKVRVYDKGIDTTKVPQSDQERYKTLIQYRYGDMRAPVYELWEALLVECRHFVDCIINKTKPTSDGYSGLRVVRLLELAQTSLKTGQPQAVTSLETV